MPQEVKTELMKKNGNIIKLKLSHEPVIEY
mgnify:CR=1 FL=1